MSDVAPNSEAADDITKGLKFCVIEFCWLDSTVSTAPLDEPALDDDVWDEPELELELPPHPASAVAAATAQQASILWLLIHRFIERAPLDKNGLSKVRPESRLLPVGPLLLGRSCAPG